MTPTAFRELLKQAIRGDNDAVEKILLLYMPLINHYSIINGKLDEDCRQHILIHTALSIRKFVI